MKPAFNVKSARLDVLAIHLHSSDIHEIRETLQQSIEKYIKFKALPFVLDLSLIDDPSTLPLIDIVALFALYEIDIVALRHNNPDTARYAAQNNLSFVAPQKPELPAEMEHEAEVIADDEPAKDASENTEAVAEQDTLYNDNDAVKTVEISQEAELVALAEPETATDNGEETPAPADTMPPTDDEGEAAPEKVALHEAKPTIVISTSVRTGQQIYAEQADLIILGAVSPGAEVIADGNIHIYSTLRGRALAGASGDTKARIFVQSMQAELVSIAGIYRVFEQSLPPHLHRKPVQIELQDDERLAIGAIIAE